MIRVFIKYKEEIGITTSKFNQKYKICYLNGKRGLKKNYYFPGDATAIDRIKSQLIKKVTNEHSERFCLGIGGLDKEGALITYGVNSKYGYIDTTGTASGINSTKVIKKALQEQIEKNELMNFWYTDRCEKYLIRLDNKYNNLIKECNFIADSIIVFAFRSLSNNFTVLSLSFKDRQLTGCGINLSEQIGVSINNAILENKIIEWQNYRNPFSTFYKKCVELEHLVYDEICMKKQDNELDINSLERILETKLLNEDSILYYSDIVLLGNTNSSLKTIKVLSKFLLNCVPTQSNMKKSKSQGILKGIDFENHRLDCIIV